MNLKKLERYLGVNLLWLGPRLVKKEFTGPRSRKGWETLAYSTQSVIAQWMNMDHWWNYIEGIRENASKQTQCHCQFISLKFHMELLGVITSFRDEGPAINVVSHGMVPVCSKWCNCTGNFTHHKGNKSRFRNIMFKKQRAMDKVQNHIRILLMIVIKSDKTSWFCGIPEQQQESVNFQRVKMLQFGCTNCSDLFTQGTMSDSAVFTRHSHWDVSVRKRNKTRH